MFKTFRFLLVLVIFGALFWAVGLENVIETLKNIDIFYIGILILLSVVMIWASCLKWQLFIRAGGDDAGIFRLMRLYTIGYFFNIFIPAYIGGDVARSYQLGKYIKNQKNAFAYTFLERFTGLLAMALLGVTFATVGTNVTQGLELAIYSVGACAIYLGLICFIASFSQYNARILFSLLKTFGLKKISSKIESFYEKAEKAMEFGRSNLPLFLKAMGLSIFFHFLTIVNTYVAALAVGWLDPNFGALFVVVPLVLLVSLAPITPSGLGVQEGAFTVLLQRIGGTEAQGLGVGLVLRAKVMVVAMVGGLLLLWARKQERE